MIYYATDNEYSAHSRLQAETRCRFIFRPCNEIHAEPVFNFLVSHSKATLVITRRCNFFHDSDCQNSEIIELLADETLVPVLPDWRSPSAGLYAVTPGKDIPAKVKMIIDALKLFFRKYE